MDIIVFIGHKLIYHEERDHKIFFISFIHFHMWGKLPFHHNLGVLRSSQNIDAII